MISLPHSLRLLSDLFSVSFMLWLGVRTTHIESIFSRKEKSAIARALLCNAILAPAIAILLWRIIPMPKDIGHAFLLIALTPGGLFGLHFTHLAKGDIRLAISLSFILVLAAILTLPLATSLILPTDVSSKVLDFRILFETFLLMLIPLGFGQILIKYWAYGAKILEKMLGIMIPIIYLSQELVANQIKSFSIHSIGEYAILAFMIFIIACWIIGWCLGGPDTDRRKVLAIDTSMRNIAICWLIVQRSFADINIDYAILAFSGISVPMNFVFGIIARIVFKKSKSAQD